MKITPKQRLGHALGWCIHRGWQADQESGFWVSFFVRAEFTCAPGKPPVLTAAETVVASGDTPFDDASHGLRYPSDFVPRKPFGEVIVVGTANPPAGLAVTRYPVRVTVGSWWKEIVVHGERSWDTSGLFDKPGPAGVAASVPLSFARAFGGAGVATNPLGFGATGEAVPNLELANRPVASRRPDGDPAGFGPIPPDWPQRRQYAGMPGKAVAASWWPWSPPGFDERFWMATLPDQWVEGYFRGDEVVELDHLHPEHSRWRTALPGQRARVFVLRLPADAPLSSARRGKLVDAGATFEEVPLVLDTVFIDTDAGEMTLVWRGSTPVRSPKLLDILGVSFGLEPLGADRDPEHYLAMLLADENEAAEPVPDGAAIKAEIEAAIAAGEAERDRIMAHIEAEVAKAQETVLATVRDVEATADAARAEAIAELAAGGIADSVTLPEFRLSDKLRFDVPDPATIPSQGAVGDVKKVAADLRASLQTTEVELPAAVKDAITGQAAKLDELAGVVAEAEEIPAQIEARMKAMKAEVESAFPPGFLVNRVIKPGDPLDLEAIRRNGLADHDLRGVDFSGLDLAGVSFRGAIASGSLFRGAKLAAADFTGANLTGADLSAADLSIAVLERADLTDATVAGTRFAGSRIGGASLRGLTLAGADFTGARGQYAEFSGADLSAACFREARLDKPDFTGTRAAGADFSGAVMPKADFGGAVCHDAIFDGATLANLRAREAADFTGARLHRLQADDASWTTSILDKADFEDADLRRADFSECSLDGTNFDRCDLASAVFADSHIHAAWLTDANLFRASFDRATIVGVRFDGSSLFEAGFWDASVAKATFTGATLDRATLTTARSGPG